MISKIRASSIIKRACQNYVLKRPLCISFEITHSCNAKCKHCHLHGSVKEIKASPAHLGDICRKINPVVAQISGGEPLLRHDVEEIIKEFRRPNGAPYIDITTNGALLTKKRYEQLIEAGIDQIGISLDFPDKRHDEFRGIPGLFSKIENLVRDVGNGQDKMISLICVIQRENFRDLIRMTELANDWKININFSVYTWLRTGLKEYMLTRSEIIEFRKIVSKILSIREKYKCVFTSENVFNKYIQFFEDRSIHNCKTGMRFYNVNPDGTISPCGLIIKSFRNQKELQKDFSHNNTCAFCYTSIRANTEKSFYNLVKDNLQIVKKF